jgi:isopentenyl diphosphate isomerase/L-lactate dehydrogenase-like FMN-dependent dehydrogenase
MLRDELDATMGMCGHSSLDTIDMESLATVSPLLALFPHHANYR